MPMSENRSERYQAGMLLRRAVLGDAYVDRATGDADAFSQPLQDLIAEFCWGAVWTREELDCRTRSLINIAMLSALNRPRELALHVSGALRNGCSVDEIREVMLQVAVYCGVPAAIDGMRVAREAIKQAETEDAAA